MKGKTRKSLTKRFRITKSGKILRRAAGQDHFRAKKSGKTIRQKRKWVVLSDSEKKAIRKYLKFVKRK